MKKTSTAAAPRAPRWYLAVPLAALALLALSACSKPEAAPPVVRAVRTLVVDGQGGTVEREYSAEVKARIESRLAFRVGGKVTQRKVELGQSVRAGQVLGLLDAQDLRLQQDAAQAGLTAAQANARQAAADLQRFADLRKQGFISQAEFDRHQTTHLQAEAALRQAQAQAGVQGNQAGYAALVAGGNGVITQLDLEPGQVVSPGQPVMTLALDGPRDAVFGVPEDMGATVRAMVGKPGLVKVRRWGSPDWVQATVREVSAAADPSTRTLQVKADVGQAAFELGQTATVVFDTAVRATQGVRIPLSALAERAGQSVVWVLQPATMTVQPQPVFTADITGNTVLIARGLSPQAEIVTAGVHVLSPGQKVKRWVDPAKRADAASTPSH